LRTVLLVLVNILLMLFAIPVLLVCVLFGLRDEFLAFGRWLMRVDLCVLGIDVEVTGLDRLDAETPYIFMSNHLSFLDGPALATVIGRPVRVIVKKFVFRVPVLGLGMRFSGYVPLAKEGAGAGRKSIALAARLIREKRYSFLIFPEGTRSWDGRAQPFRRGGFFLALECGSPIVPVTIRGTFELMPRGKWLVRKGLVRIAFHEPVPATGYTQETMAALMAKVEAAVLSDQVSRDPVS
jgi:1-acyl-sn-glycerol-3-phosphate acyltransferase